MHNFKGKWITDEEFSDLKPRNVFFRQLDEVKLPCDEHRNRHILFRKNFSLADAVSEAKIYISADDYYKLYINGRFAGQGPAPSYHFKYNYNIIDVKEFLIPGENTIAVHTLYQGLINRVWQSGDNRHGLILDLLVNGETVVVSDETFKTKQHTGFKEMGIVGYQTQFMEEYNSCAPEIGFERQGFDDSLWENARLRQYNDYSLSEQKTSMLVFEQINPVVQEMIGNTLRVDFGSNYVGYLCLRVVGAEGERVTIKCGQELNEDGSVRYNLRANCVYEERWILSEGESVLEQFDYKSFRYSEIELPENCELKEVYMQVRHYPFILGTDIKEKYKKNEDLKKIWDLCVHTQKYGVQEVIQDCMEREKGFYVGDGCYTALTHMILTKDDSMVRKLIDDGFASSLITEGLVTCLDCSFMQEIAEYPLMMIYLVMWHYRFTKDKEYLAANYAKVINVLESYRKEYEKDGLLQNLDKWCVVEWPSNYRDGYDVDIVEGKICEEAHVSINAYYIEAVKVANKMTLELEVEPYREEQPLINAFINAFYDAEKHLFRDGVNTNHISLVGNSFPFAFGLCPDDKCAGNIMQMFKERRLSSVSLFCAFLALMGFLRYGMERDIEKLMLDEGAWLRMISEGATTTFEGWGRDTKWNTSLFHLTMSYGALFLADIDLRKILDIPI
ncbi:MAG: hypothetical protein E7441_09555 [Ruminococcaceae bacterium]|nr:hypothetical protein [Oscillospiraceae bacterium]